jgi:predicted nucleotidyltransferase
LDEPVSKQMRTEVREKLAAIEEREQCIICLAVESGSRAWGFASPDSDYDVRFIYVRPSSWYLSVYVEDKRDIIEEPISDVLDVMGWDLRKALRLLKKSNPPLLEWLQCPIVYTEHQDIASELRSLVPEFYSPKATFHHYLHMAQGNFREYLRGETVWRKKYFYVLRPLLAMRWIERNPGPVPIEFNRLVEATVQEPHVLEAIEKLLREKRAGAELDRGPHSPALSAFIEVELQRLEAAAETVPVAKSSSDRLDDCFRKILSKLWGTVIL